MTELVSNKITIKNFVVIKDADIDIKDINIIIGPQANGKSLIAKLIYFFNSLNKMFSQHTRKEFSKDDIDGSVIKKFHDFFPSYLWSEKPFSMEYVCGNVKISIEYKKSQKKKEFSFEISYSKELLEVLDVVRKKHSELQMRRKLRDIKNIDWSSIEGHGDAWRPTNKDLRNFNPKYFGASIFIPSGRSFFSILQKNIFTLLSQNVNIDPFIKEFGSFYETTKNFFSLDSSDAEEGQLEELYQKAFLSIAKGEYLNKDGKDWIKSPAGLTTNLADTSSGQQESVPMLLVLTIYPQIMSMLNNTGIIFIEEPEAHLFPTAQGEIMSLISSIYDEYKTQFFITTHSPYVLASLNNMIQAGEVAKNGKLSKKEFCEINRGGAPISYENVSAYTIEDGVARSIMDEEYKIIGGYSLDEVSNHFQDVMNTILEKDI